jgi:uncharacterized protein YdhG (YjbR/CyaY superfamily)
MQSKAATTAEYLDNLPEEKKEAMRQLRDVIVQHLPTGFEERMSYGMITYVVPHSIYPGGYHCDPKQALPFLSIAAQKNFIAIYHMGIYADPQLLEWFQKEYAAQCKGKLDMGKSCIRFKKPEQIPFELIGELASKMTPQDWIALYERNLKK